MRFLLCSLVFSSFSRDILFQFFLSFPHVWWCSLPISSSISKFPFLQVFWFFLDFVDQFLPSFVFCFSLLALHILLCQIPSLYLNCISPLPVLCFPTSLSLLSSLLVFFVSFFTPAWSLSDTKSPQVSRTLLNILTNLKNSVVWMVSLYPLTSHSSSPLSKPLEIIPTISITIGITITFMCHTFFSPLARFRYCFLLYYYCYHYYMFYSFM